LAVTSHTHGEDRPEAEDLDAVIVGGGVAGLWLLNLLTRRGYRVRLFEGGPLGGEQTLGSQGMIHGGLKYALAAKLTTASEAIARMPDRWRECLAGNGEVDLGGLAPLSEHYYLFAEGDTLGRLTTFFASRALRGRIEKLAAAEYPPGLAAYDGVVYRLNDFVLDTRALTERLTDGLLDRVHQLRLEAPMLERSDSGWQLNVADRHLAARQLILTAGAGNGPLLKGLEIHQPQMQLRPLHQVVVRHPDLPPLHAHCLTALRRSEPRLTITSHPEPSHAGQWLWYLGGQLATDGVDRDEPAQIAAARQELDRCVPWIDLRGAEIECHRYDRAEPYQPDRRRPDEAFVTRTGDAVVCWPTKLSLTPDLGDRVLDLLHPPEPGAALMPLALPPPPFGVPPWCR
jgi:glycerol-3-phosphate dehydrogenase